MRDDPTDQDIEAQEKEADEARLTRLKLQRVEDIKWLVAHAPGRRIAWGWLSEARVFNSSFDNSGSVTAYREGRRSMGLFLLDRIMEHAPEAFTKMLSEQPEK